MENEMISMIDPEVFRNVASALAIGLGAIGPGIGIGIIGGKTIEAVGRNPEIQGTAMTLMFITIAFTEALAIFGLVISLLIKFGG